MVNLADREEVGGGWEPQTPGNGFGNPSQRGVEKSILKYGYCVLSGKGHHLKLLEFFEIRF
jgi:hypothetical protein